LKKVEYIGYACANWHRRFRFTGVEKLILMIPEIAREQDKVYAPLKLKVTIEEIDKRIQNA